VRITRQVASALEYAHGQEIVHRDIKPENILLHRGEVMVADFGIALAVTAAGGTRLTETGMSIGTPQYMSPEQASGDKHIDGRTDIYSLGCVLYEMLVGEAPYTGPSSQAIIAKVLTETPPPIRRARDTVSPALEQVVFKSLAKLAADRFGTAQQLADALGVPTSASVTVTAPVAAEARRTDWLARWRWGVTAALATIAVLLMLSRLTSAPAVSTGVRRFVVRTPPGRTLDQYSGLELSRDGSSLVVYVYDFGFLLHDFADGEGRILAGGAGEIKGMQAFFSPDGQRLAFHNFEDHELRWATVEGGEPVVIEDSVTAWWGGTWGMGDEIIYAPGALSGLWRVPVEGGVPEQLTFADTVRGIPAYHVYPQFLPEGRRVLFSYERTPLDSAGVEVLDLDTGVRTTILKRARFGRYVPTGHLLFMRHEALWAAPFDPDRLEVTGSPQIVLEDVAYSWDRGFYAVSDNGTLAYVKASVWNVPRQLVWVDRNGSEQVLMDEWDRYGNPAISPDGKRVTYALNYPGHNDIWVYDLERRGIPTRVTRDEEYTALPRWTRDGTRIVYTKGDLYVRDWQAATPAEPLLSVSSHANPGSISPDGSVAVTFTKDFEAGGTWDLWLVPLEEDGEPRIYRATEHEEYDPAFSPDGRWIAYNSTESGDWEIWLQSYPDTARARYRVSNGGGWAPAWGPDGELFYISPVDGTKMMAVQIDLESGVPGVPRVLFDGESYELGDVRNYDVSADGQRFLMVKPHPGAEPREVTVVVNWFEELERIVPGGRR